MRDVNALPWLNLAHTLLEGDGTYTWDGEPFTPDSGFQVGGFATLKDPETPEILAEWLHRQYEFFGPYNYVTHLGSWRDPDTGTLYIDVTDHWNFLETALEVARVFEEKAIWDWKNSEAIEV